MICNTCFKMLRGQDGRIWKGTYDLNFTHHTQMTDLCHSADEHCGICRVLFAELQSRLGLGAKASSSSTPTHSQLVSHSQKAYWAVAQIVHLLNAIHIMNLLQLVYALFNAEVEPNRQAAEQSVAVPAASIDALPLSITASLRVGQRRTANETRSPGELYYLTFVLRSGNIRCRRTFALQQTGTVNQCSVVVYHYSRIYSLCWRPSISDATVSHHFIRLCV